MKNLLLVVLSIVCFSSLTMAQTTSYADVTEEEYERMLENELSMEFRTYAYSKLNLTEKEIEDMDPYYLDYMNKKSDLMDERMKLINKYSDKLEKINSEKNMSDEKADFIEDYWEVAIDEMELKKDYFDKFEDRIGYDKAAQFFLLEETLQNRVIEQPIYMIIPLEQRKKHHKDKKKNDMQGNSEKMKNSNSSMSYTDDKNLNKNNKKDWKKDNLKDFRATKSSSATKSAELKAYSKWVKDSKGKVAIDHAYTNEGLTKLVTALSSFCQKNGIEVKDMESTKEEIMSMAEQLTVDPTSLEHADMTKEAFMKVSKLLSDVQLYSDSDRETIVQVEYYARQMNPDIMMTKQADKIYGFFESAEKALKSISNSTITVSNE